MAPLAQWTGGRVSPRYPVGGASGLVEMATDKIESMLYKWINGSGKLTETENVIFYASYGILADEHNSCVLLQRSMDIRLRINGNVMLETRCYSVSQLQVLLCWTAGI